MWCRQQMDSDEESRRGHPEKHCRTTSWARPTDCSPEHFNFLIEFIYYDVRSLPDTSLASYRPLNVKRQRHEKVATWHVRAYPRRRIVVVLTQCKREEPSSV